MLTFDHIGIIAPTVEDGVASLRATLPIIGISERFDDAVLGVSVQFLKDRSDITFEIIAPLGSNSPVAQSIVKDRNRLQQLAYLCDNLEQSAKELRASGAVPLGQPKPAIAFNGAPVQFFWARSGFVVELIEGYAEQRRYHPI